MTDTQTSLINRPAWVELSSTDAAAARDYYSRLFGWDVQVSEDPQYGGYGIAKDGGDDVAGIGGQQIPGAPSNWGVYIGTEDVDALANAVGSAGGTVIAAPFDVGDQGRMAVFQDPTGAFISAWQATGMRSFGQGRTNTFGWTELNTRDVARAIRFYRDVFGWGERTSDIGSDYAYTEFQQGGESVAGALPMQPGMPDEVPAFWTVYFNVDDVDRGHEKAVDLGGQSMVEPQDFPGGRFALVTDPTGAMFGLLKVPQA